MYPQPSTTSLLPSPNEEPSTFVDLSVSCRKLRDLDILSKSDPQVVLFMKMPIAQNHSQFEWREIGRTEIIWNNLNPKFTHSFRLTYHFEQMQELKFVVVDIDKKNSRNLADQDLIGSSLCTMAEIVAAPGSVLSKHILLDPSKPPQHQKSRGQISIRAEEVSGTQDVVHFNLRATGLDKKDFFGKSDPFLVINRGNIEDAGSTPVYKTEVHKKTLNVTWKRFSLMVNKLCNGDYGRSLVFEVWDWNRSGSHDYIGAFHTNLKQLLTYRTGDSVPLINDKKKAKKEKKGKTYKNSGKLVLDVRLEKVNSFLDYVRGGYELNLNIAVDFTYSNKNPTDRNSLHYVHPNGLLNGYQRAILDVGRILLEYDKDKMVSMFGFGAKILQHGQWNVSHCFPCNFNWQNAEVQGIEGIMQAYKYALNNIQFFGPTNFEEIIRRATAKARAEARGAYQILLILTDGVISDMHQTVNAIVDASDAPLSIVVVGIGNADFSRMEVLDADDNPLRSSDGRVMKRDIVQFVPFSQFINRAGKELSEEVLREIPSQFLSYVKAHNIPPPEKIRVDSFANLSTQQQHTAPVQAPQHMPAPQMPASNQQGQYPGSSQQPTYGAHSNHPVYPPNQQMQYPPQNNGQPPQGGQPSYSLPKYKI